MKNAEMIALGLAALAVYFVVKARNKATTAPPPEGYFYDKNGKLQKMPATSGERIFTNWMIPEGAYL